MQHQRDKRRTRAKARFGFGWHELETRRILAVNVFSDSLAAGWQDWSWGTARSFQPGGTVHAGTTSLAVTHQEAWGGLYLAFPEVLSVAGTEQLRFVVHGGTGGQRLQLHVVSETDAWVSTPLATLTDSWNEVFIDLQAIGAADQVKGLVWQDAAGGAQPTYYLDDIAFIERDPVAPAVGPSIVIHPQNLRHAIPDTIYGLNFADEAFAAEIQLPVDRWGGNATTRYNYQLDTTNLASDWFFENYPADNDNVSQLPRGSSADQFVEKDNRVGAATIMTVGTIGWTPNSREIRGSFSVDDYGPQQQVDPYRPNFGNGVTPSGQPIIGNDPYDTSEPIDATFAAGWVEHLVAEHGTAQTGGVAYYALDNEPMLWNSTHRDVHPQPATYDEVLERGLDYATAIKQVDPSAQILGPSVWGWTAYFYSALDAAGLGAWWNNPQDRNAHGGMPFLPWYLEQMAEAESQTGTRLLDYLDIHYYPQTSGVALQSAGNSQTQRERLLSTRSLWDSAYVDNSWIDTNVELIPRMRDWIDTYYPDTKLAITEYNWGALDHINGALAQADVLGIFGREQVDLATLWAPPASNEPGAYAFRMYRNYDGQRDATSMFGDTSVSSSSADSDTVSVFAARRSADSALTVMLINKTSVPRTTPLSLDSAATEATVEVYTYDANHPTEIVRGSDLVWRADQPLELTLPANSITLLEIVDTSASLLGDFDRDGTVTADDIDRLSLAIRAGESDLRFDLNQDRVVDPVDRDFLLSDILHTAYGDADLNGTFDSLDFQAWREHRFSQQASWASGDFNGDANVDVRDFHLWWAARYRSQSTAPSVSRTPIAPLPDVEAIDLLKNLRTRQSLRLRRV